jgi:Ca-activated chloride channel family protein
MKNNIYIFLFLSMILVSNLGCQKQIQEFDSISYSKKANQSIKNSQGSQAFDESVKGLQADSFQVAHHINLGLSLEILGNSENAIKAYMNAKKLGKTDAEKYIAAFDIAQLYGKGKKIDEALEFYQEALKHNPSSKEVKTNIELLIQNQQGENKKDQDQDQKDDKKDQDKKEQDKKGNGDPKDNKDSKDKGKPDKENDKQQEPKPKEYKQNSKYVPRQFKGKDLGEADVKKILGELKNQEQRIRAEYNQREAKERPNGKDW